MSPRRLLISGATGRMGRAVARLAQADAGVELVGGVDRAGSAGSFESAERVVALDDPESRALIAEAEVIIDFSAPAFLRELLETRGDALAGKALVVGTTGLAEEERWLLDRAAERSAVLVAANFSVGVNLLLLLAERAAAALGEEFDVEIVETHHRRKEDAPSGTALALGEAVARGREVELSAVRRDGRSGRPGARPRGEVGFHALRGGDVIGDHQLHFISDLERIELVHRASDRSLFAAGALRAARWLASREPGRYSMRDVLGLSDPSAPSSAGADRRGA
jgi:4-hydroxy-tetrahydrodipicolinate reductase